MNFTPETCASAPTEFADSHRKPQLGVSSQGPGQVTRVLEGSSIPRKRESLQWSASHGLFAQDAKSTRLGVPEEYWRPALELNELVCSMILFNALGFERT